MTISEKRADRAAQIATLAVLLNANAPRDIASMISWRGRLEESVKDAEAVLVAAEDLVAKKYGEFR